MVTWGSEDSSECIQLVDVEVLEVDEIGEGEDSTLLGLEWQKCWEVRRTDGGRSRRP